MHLSPRNIAVSIALGALTGAIGVAVVHAREEACDSASRARRSIVELKASLEKMPDDASGRRTTALAAADRALADLE